MAEIKIGSIPNLGVTIGTLPIASGGTGNTTAANAINALLPAQGSASGKYLTSNGSVASWGTVTASSAYTIVSKSISYTPNAGEFVLCSGAAIVITLPTAVGVSGQTIIVKKTDSSLANTVTFNTTSSQTIDGSASGVLTLNTQNEQVAFVSDNVNWQVLEHNIPSAWTNAGAVTITGSTTNPTKGTMTTDAFYWRRVGASMEFRYLFNQSTGGTSGSGDYSFTIPVSGVTIDTAKLVVNTTVYGASNEVGADIVGVSTLITAGTTRNAGFVYVATNTTLKIWIPGTAVFASVSGIAGATCVTMLGSIPITNWWA